MSEFLSQLKGKIARAELKVAEYQSNAALWNARAEDALALKKELVELLGSYQEGIHQTTSTPPRSPTQKADKETSGPVGPEINNVALARKIIKENPQGVTMDDIERIAATMGRVLLRTSIPSQLRKYIKRGEITKQGDYYYGVTQ